MMMMMILIAVVVSEDYVTHWHSNRVQISPDTFTLTVWERSAEVVVVVAAD